MAQLTLFDARETRLVDDERGTITYARAFIDADTARAWFTEIRAGVRWRAERRMMYEREVEVPRLVSHFRLNPPDELVPAALVDAARRVTERLREPFNIVGLNLYGDGRDSVAPHNDHLNEIRTGFSIALVSLGATCAPDTEEMKAAKLKTGCGCGGRAETGTVPAKTEEPNAPTTASAGIDAIRAVARPASTDAHRQVHSQRDQKPTKSAPHICTDGCVSGSL